MITYAKEAQMGELEFLNFFVLDNNECELGTDLCDDNASCTNTKGSYECACNIGFQGDGRNCEGMSKKEKFGEG